MARLDYDRGGNMTRADNQHAQDRHSEVRRLTPNAPDRAINWLKMSAKEHISAMRELVALLRHKDVAVEELQTDRPG